MSSGMYNLKIKILYLLLKSKTLCLPFNNQDLEEITLCKVYFIIFSNVFLKAHIQMKQKTKI